MVNNEMFNVTEIPEIFGEWLGLGLEPTAILLTIIGLMAISITLAVLELSNMGIAVIDVGWISFCTFMQWFPIWIMIIISLIIAVLFARKTVKYIGGSGE